MYYVYTMYGLYLKWDGIFSGMAETAELAETAESSYTYYGKPRTPTTS